MRIERSGTQRWLVVGGAPDKFWPVVKEFWQELGFLVNVEIPEAGIMETDWAENRAKTAAGRHSRYLGQGFRQPLFDAERDKFRTRLEKGAETGYGGNLHQPSRHVRGLYQRGQDGYRWQPRPADPELEAEMLRG
jgi:outer membrane protein assembly factor BamC